MLPDMRRIDTAGNANAFEFLPRADPGQQQQMRRTDSAGADDHFLASEGRSNLAGLSAIFDADCDCVPPRLRG